MRWPDDRVQELVDGLMDLLAVATSASSAQKVPGVVVDLLEELHAEAMSDLGHAGPGAVTLGDVSDTWVIANEAGRAVGMTGRQVRRLCSAGLVRHRVTRAGYKVDVEDLRRHLSGGAS